MTEVKDPFAVGEWVVCVKGGETYDIGDIMRVDKAHDYVPNIAFISAGVGYYKPHFRSATPEEIDAHLGRERKSVETRTSTDAAPTGGLSGHYLVEVPEPQRGGPSYTAECDDIIFALNMTFDEGEAFKAIWRTCTSRLGYGKEGNTPLYNAQKLVHRAGRILKRAEEGE